jgi:hypothetical protein
MSNSKGWMNVEDGSTFHLTVNGDDTHSVKCVVDGIEVDCDPFPQTLRSPHRYQWVVAVRLGSGPATVAATIRKPSGTQHGKAFNVTLQDAAGQVAFVFLSAVTRI